MGAPYPYGDLAGDLFKEYLISGGMPEAVRSFVETGEFSEARTIFNRLQTAYLDDIRKYARSRENSKYLEIVLEYAPRLAGSIFKYENFGGSGYRSREMGDAIQTVEKVMLLKQVLAVNSTQLPITPKAIRPKKMIYLDVGLVNFANNAYQELLVGEYNGRVMEQVVGQSLLAGGISRPFDLYYWSRDRNEGTAEVDFYFQYQTRLVGMEVKSGGIARMKSLFSLGASNPEVSLVRVSWDGLGVEPWQYGGTKYKILSLPFYLVERWYDFV
ncbi:MAG: DUF4143 domain-containing protein [Anaerolineae bacterium]|nr:DUF4143 domain-containing protein [Anaerolineae bacterium]